MIWRWLPAVILLGISSIAMGSTTVVVVLDDSGSMADRMRQNRRVRKMDAAKQALIQVLEGLPEDAQVGLLCLNHSGVDSDWILPLGPLEKPTIRPAVSRIRASGGTPLGRFMKQGADALLQARQQEPFGIYRLLIVTDGEATDRRLVERYLPDIVSRGITVDVIGVDMRQDHSLATRVHRYRRADDPASLQREISAVFAESSGTDSAAAGDFQLLSGLTPEWATAAIASLTRVSNEPIGERRFPDGSTGLGQTPPDSDTPGSLARGFMTIVLGLAFGLVVLVGIVFLGIVFAVRRSF